LTVTRLKKNVSLTVNKYRKDTDRDTEEGIEVMLTDNKKGKGNIKPIEVISLQSKKREDRIVLLIFGEKINRSPKNISITS
jgi:hypothetical protein